MKMCRNRFAHSGYLFEWIKCQMQKLYYYVDDLWRMRKDISAEILIVMEQTLTHTTAVLLCH